MEWAVIILGSFSAIMLWGGVLQDKKHKLELIKMKEVKEDDLRTIEFRLRDSPSWLDPDEFYKAESPSSAALAALPQVEHPVHNGRTYYCNWCPTVKGGGRGCLERLPSDTPPEIVAKFGDRPYMSTCYHGRKEDLRRTGYEYYTIRELRFVRKIEAMTMYLKKLAAYADKIETLDKRKAARLQAEMAGALSYLQSVGIYPTATDDDDEEKAA